MLRFIFNFILFGIIFYLIYIYFPDGFATLVRWVETAWNWIVDTFSHLFSKMGSTPPPVKP